MHAFPLARVAVSLDGDLQVWHKVNCKLLSGEKMAQVYQGIQPSWLLERLSGLNLPQRTLAELAGISESQLSQFLNRKRGLSSEVQLDIFEVLRWGRELQATSSVPIDFGNLPAITKLWRQFRAAAEESAVVRAASEILEGSDAQPTILG
jgi:transcriptional regulator with XRE-family HTH domain